MTGVVPKEAVRRIINAGLQHPTVEGPALTRQEAEAFRNAVAQYNGKDEGSPERVHAIGTIYAVMLRMVRAKEKDQTLSHKDEVNLAGKKTRLEGMVEELLQACKKDDLEVRLNAFGSLFTIADLPNHVMVRPFVIIANNHDDPDMRIRAVNAIYSLMLKEEPRTSYLTIGTERIPLTTFYRRVLTDLAKTGTYSDVRSEVVNCFSSSKDSTTLRGIQEGTKYRDTKERAFKALIEVDEARRRGGNIDADEILGALGVVDRKDDPKLRAREEAQATFEKYDELKAKSLDGSGRVKLRLIHKKDGEQEEPPEPPPSPALAQVVELEREGSEKVKKQKAA